MIKTIIIGIIFGVISTLIITTTATTSTAIKAAIEANDTVAQTKDWTLQIQALVGHPYAGPVTISMQGPGFSDSMKGVFGIFTVPWNSIQPGDTYVACAADNANGICKRLTHVPGDSESVVVNLP